MSSETVSGGELVARTLAHAGVNKIFTLHGGHMDSIFQGCVRHGIELIDTRHEAAAGHAAEAYARMTGDLAVCIVTSGAGFVNGFPAYVNASLDGTPVLFIAGAPPLREAYTNELQGGFDQIATAQPVMKWAYRVTNGERIPDIVAEAVRVTRNGRPGPVLLELPIDVLHIPVREQDATQPTGINNVVVPAPTKQAVADLAELLRGAERPAIIAGAGAMHSGCSDELQAFAEHSGIPVFANMKALGILDAGHPLMGNLVGGLAALAPMGMEPPDVVVLLGARLGFGMGGRSGVVVPETARLAQIDVDGETLGRLQEVEVPIAADCREVLAALLEETKDRAWPDWAEWAGQAVNANDLITSYSAERYPEYADSGKMHPFHAAKALCQALPADACFALDGGDCQSWLHSNVRISRGSRLIGGGALGHLGVGPGYAMGMQTAAPGKPVVLLTGDGALGFHIQEFHSMVRHGLPIVTVVFCNAVWGTSRNGQKVLFGEEHKLISELGEVPYHDVARAFGAHGEQVERLEDIGPAVERALASGKPACINVMVDGEAVTDVVEALETTKSPEEEIVIPYYEAIPVSSI